MDYETTIYCQFFLVFQVGIVHTHTVAWIFNWNVLYCKHRYSYSILGDKYVVVHYVWYVYSWWLQDSATSSLCFEALHGCLRQGRERLHMYSMHDGYKMQPQAHFVLALHGCLGEITYVPCMMVTRCSHCLTLKISMERLCMYVCDYKMQPLAYFVLKISMAALGKGGRVASSLSITVTVSLSRSTITAFSICNQQNPFNTTTHIALKAQHIKNTNFNVPKASQIW